jgi:lysozyme
MELVAYPDADGWAIGVGHNLKYPIPQEAAEIIFNADYEKAIHGYYSLSIEIRGGLTLARRQVLVEMIFQLGVAGVLKFKKMCAALIAKDYHRAAVEIMDSKAAKQCPERFQEYAELMRNG